MNENVMRAAKNDFVLLAARYMKGVIGEADKAYRRKAVQELVNISNDVTYDNGKYTIEGIIEKEDESGSYIFEFYHYKDDDTNNLLFNDHADAIRSDALADENFGHFEVDDAKRYILHFYQI